MRSLASDPKRCKPAGRPADRCQAHQNLTGERPNIDESRSTVRNAPLVQSDSKVRIPASQQTFRNTCPC